jgi:hypothetical protein
MNPRRRGGKPATIFFYLVCEAIGTAPTPAATNRLSYGATYQGLSFIYLLFLLWL